MLCHPCLYRRLGFDVALQLLENLEFPTGAPWKPNDVKHTTAADSTSGSSGKRKNSEHDNHILEVALHPDSILPSDTQQLVVVNRHKNTPPCSLSQKRRRVDCSFPMNVATLAIERLTQQEIKLLFEKHLA